MQRVLISTAVALLTVGSVMVFALGLVLVANNESSLALAQSPPQTNPMRGMMRQMMQGLVPPPGMTPERLPDFGDQGALLVGRYCSQCHDLPSPRYKTADQWPAVFDRMLGRMNMMSGGGMMGRGMMGRGMMGMGRIETPTASEARTLLNYLQRNAMVVATAEQLAIGPAQERAVFQSQCARCHALPSPTLYPPEMWPGIVARMQANMKLMNKPGPTARQREAIIRFLKESSAGTR